MRAEENKNQNQQGQVSIADQIKESIANVSQSKKFQKKLMVFFLLISFFTWFQYLSSVVFYMSPVFQCENYDYKVSEDQACKMLDFCKLSNKQTIVAELGLYCNEKKGQRTFIQTAAGIGNWIGILFAGAISDRKGRKFCLCVGFILLNATCLFQLLGVFTENVHLLMLSQLIAGVCNKVIYLNLIVILTRFMDKKWYQAGTLGWFIVGNGLGLIVIAAINDYFENWRALFYLQAVGVAVCTIISIFGLLEDPIYLFDVGKLKESKQIIQIIGEENGVDFYTNQTNLKKIDLIFQMKMQQIENKGQANKFKFNIRQILRCDIVTRILLIGIVGCFLTMAIKSIELSIQNLKNSYNFNIFILGLSNICGFVSAMYIIQIQTKRKRGLIYTSIIYGVIAFLLAFPFCYQNGSIQTLILFFLRLVLGWICNFFTRLKVDSFPEKYQLTCLSILQSISNLGGVFGPMLIQQSTDRHLNPIFTINILRLTVGTLPLLCISQEKIILNQSDNELISSISPKKVNKQREIAA